MIYDRNGGDVSVIENLPYIELCTFYNLLNYSHYSKLRILLQFTQQFTMQKSEYRVLVLIMMDVGDVKVTEASEAADVNRLALLVNILCPNVTLS